MKNCKLSFFTYFLCSLSILILVSEAKAGGSLEGIDQMASTKPSFLQSREAGVVKHFECPPAPMMKTGTQEQQLGTLTYSLTNGDGPWSVSVTDPSAGAGLQEVRIEETPQGPVLTCEYKGMQASINIEGGRGCHVINPNQPPGSRADRFRDDSFACSNPKDCPVVCVASATEEKK
jgi:hypothetical protein